MENYYKKENSNESVPCRKICAEGAYFFWLLIDKIKMMVNFCNEHNQKEKRREEDIRNSAKVMIRGYISP